MPDIARRGFLAGEWSAVEASDVSVLTANLLAPQLEEETLLVSSANASTEASRRLTLRKVHRDRFEAVVPLDSTTLAIDLGDVVKLTHARFGLVSGRKFVVLGVEPNAIDGTITLNLWG